jgi:ABC-type branched-subunit amino acid transport system ATPase component
MVLGMAESCIILEKGRIVARGAPHEIAGSNLMQQYLAL